MAATPSPWGSATDTSADTDEIARRQQATRDAEATGTTLPTFGALPSATAPALPIAAPPDATTQPVKRPVLAGSDAQGNDGAPTTDPVSRPTSPSAPSTPTPFQTPDPLAFLPLASATSAMTPSTPTPAPTSNVTGNVTGQIAPTGTPVATPVATGAAPASPDPAAAPGLPPGFTQGTGDDYGRFYYNGQRVMGIDQQTGQVILDDGSGNDPRGPASGGLQSYIDSPAFQQTAQQAMDAQQLAAGQSSPNASMAALYHDPAYLAARAQGASIGADGSLIDPTTGATISPPNPALAQTIAAPLAGLGLNLDGSPLNGLPGTGASGPSDVPPGGSGVPSATPLTVPTPTLAPIPGSTPSASPPAAPPTATPAASPAANLNGLPATTPTPAATPASTPSNPSNPSATSATSDANGLPSRVTTPGPAMNAVTLTPTTPSNALTNATISPGPATDRFAIANQRISDWNATEQPMFEQDLRRIAQDRAGAGQIGSGMVRGAFRDAATDLNTRRQTAERGFLTDALTGSIDDAYKNIGIAQQQQGVQIGQQQTAFNQNVQLQQLADSEQGQQYGQLMTSLGFNAQQVQQAFENAFKVQQLSDDETGQAFYRALQQYIQGSANDPASYYAWLAGQWATTGAK